MFGVIICPKCHRARGVKLPSKTAVCVHCGHSIDVSKARVYFRTGSEAELRRGVQKMTERLATNLEDYPAERKHRVRKEGGESAPPAKLSEGTLQAAARKLTEQKGDFGAEDLREALGLPSEEEAQKALEALRSGGMIFEHRADRFKAL
jgi:hypothetical protein